jgi:hypothetical protein
MDKSYQMWIEHTAVKGGILLRHHGSAYPEFAQLTTDATVRCSDPVYTGAPDSSCRPRIHAPARISSCCLS